MQILRIIPAGDCWAVDWSETSQARFVARLFGTELIPTPFTRLAEAGTVQRHVQRLNPEYRVEVRGAK